MKRPVLWSEDAERLLMTIAPSEADRIVDAVVRLAETGVGFVRRMLDGSAERRMYLRSWIVTFTLDEGVIFVLRIEAR